MQNTALRKLKKALEVYFPTASSQEKLDLIILPAKSLEVKELTKKSALSPGKCNLTFYINEY